MGFLSTVLNAESLKMDWKEKKGIIYLIIQTLYELH